MHNFQIKILDKRGMPRRATPMSAGYDVVACIDEPIVIRKGEKAQLIPLGFACYMADGHVSGIILPRSGLGHKEGLTLGNTAGVIDGDYHGQWFASAWNRGQQDEIVINPGDRIAQIIFVPVVHPTFTVVEEFAEVTARGKGGFGSTGIGHALKQEGVICAGLDASVLEDLASARKVDLPPMGSLGEVIEQ